MILTRFGCEDCSRLIRSHSGSRIRKVILELPVMAAGGAAGSASRELPAPRRPVRAPLLFNEKEYFYRARVLRRARKEAVSAGRPDRPAVQVSSQEIADLFARCAYLEWCAASAHQHAAHLHERVCELEAATRPLSAEAAPSTVQPLGPAVGSASSSTTPTDAVAQASVAP